jgi:DNA-binding CsgD family transcriptional regulator
MLIATALTWSDEFESARSILTSVRDRAYDRAEESSLPWILVNLGLVEFLAGRWEEAERYARDGNEIAAQTGQEPQRLSTLAVLSLVNACRGNVQAARADAEIVLGRAEVYGAMLARIIGSTAIGLLELSLDHPDAAHRLLGPLGEQLEEGGVREPGSAAFIPDEIEALIGLGRLDEAEVLLDRLERRARRLDRASALAAGGRCRGLLAAATGDLNSALTVLEQAMAEYERVPIPFERARTLLALGSTSRRAKRKRAARESLQEALTIFEELGARLWADKARAGLARIGGRAPATEELTATERRVASLAAEGRSNKEIGAALFVTVKTVEANLSRIYAKLGVRSRAALAHHFASEESENEGRKL